MIEQVGRAVLWALIGLCLGSFATTAALRLRRSEPSVFGRSRCDHCAAPLSYALTTPIWGYVRQGGACRICGSPIDLTHMLGELIGGLVVASCCMILPPAQGVAIAAIGLVLLASSVVDAKTRRLPDRLTLVVALLALLADGINGLAAVAEGVLAGVLTFVILEIVRRSFLRFSGRPGLGFGDVKLAAALALWLGVATPWAVALASGVALMAMIIVRPADGRLAFGPALAAGGWLVGFAKEAHLWLLPV